MTPTQTEPSRWSFYYISNVFLCALSAVTCIGVMYAAYKTAKLVWPKEKVIPVMLVFLSLSLLGSFCFFLWSLLRVYQWPYPPTVPDQVLAQEACELSVFPFLPVIFLSVAVILNIDKWLYFYFRIIAEHKSLKNKSLRNLHIMELTQRRNILHWVHFSLCAAYIIWVVAFMVYGCSH